MKNKKDFLDILKGLATTQNNIRDVFGNCNILDYEINDLANIIMEQYNIPQEDDLVFEQLMNFAYGDITKKKLLGKYLNFLGCERCEGKLNIPHNHQDIRELK